MKTFNACVTVYDRGENEFGQLGVGSLATTESEMPVLANSDWMKPISVFLSTAAEINGPGVHDDTNQL